MNVGVWEWGPIQGIEIHTVNCSEYRYTVVGIVPFVQKVTHTGEFMESTK